MDANREPQRWRSRAHPQKKVLVRQEVVTYSVVTNDHGEVMPDVIFSESIIQSDRTQFLKEFEPDDDDGLTAEPRPMIPPMKQNV